MTAPGVLLFMHLTISPLKRALAISAFLGALAAAPLLAQTNAPAISPTHRIELFDGKTLDGWKIVAKTAPTNGQPEWSVHDGVIACAGRPAGYARTLEHYRDYQLHVEWRWPKGPGNSGVFLHLSGPDKVWPLCFEAQLLAGDAGTLRMNGGALVKELTAADPKDNSRRTPGTEKPPGEWNSYDITCRSNTVTLRVNGVLQSESTEASIQSGAIALQAEGKLVEFRNIFIEPLSASEAAK